MQITAFTMMQILLIFVLLSSFAEGYLNHYMPQNPSNQNEPQRRSHHVVQISSENLLHLLTSSAKLRNNNTGQVPGATFFETYYRFMVPFENETSVVETLNTVAEHNSNYSLKTSDSVYFYEIFISLAPKSDIALTLDKILNVTKQVNTIHESTVLAVTIDYGFLRLDSESVPVVQEDVQLCNRKFQHSLVCGFILIRTNCDQPYLTQLKWERQNFVLISADTRADTRYITARDLDTLTCSRQKDFLMFLPNAITIDFSTFTYSHEWILFDRETGRVEDVVGVKILHDEDTRDKDESSKKLLTNEIWMRRPSLFDFGHAGVSLSTDVPFQLKLTESVVEKFRIIIVEVGGANDSLKMEQYMNSFALHNQKTSAGSLIRNQANAKNNLKIKIQVVIDYTSFEGNQALLDKVFDTIRIFDSKSPGMIDTLILDRNRCLDGRFFTSLNDVEENAFKVENKTWDYILFKMGQLKLQHPLKLGTVFDKKEGLMHKFMERQYQEDLQPQPGDTSDEKDSFTQKILALVKSTLSYQAYFTFRKMAFLQVDMHYLVYKLDVCFDRLVVSGAQETFRDLRADIHAGDLSFYYFTEKAAALDFPAPTLVYHITVTGCSGRNPDLEALTEFNYFYDIVNKWAVTENKHVIVGNAFEVQEEVIRENRCQCASHNDTCIYTQCRCGLWSIKNIDNEIHVEDKKSALLKLYNEKIYARSDTDTGNGDIKVFSQRRYLAILLPILLLAMVLSALAPYLIHRHRNKHFIDRRHLQKFFHGSGSDETNSFKNASDKANSQPYNKKELEIPRSSLKIDSARALGSGEFGQVFAGTLIRGRSLDARVAVKTTIKRRSADKHGNELAFLELLSEIKVLSYIGDHENIIKLIGACTGNLKRGEVYLVLEMCPNGSLLKYLRSSNPISPAPGRDMSNPMELQELKSTTGNDRLPNTVLPSDMYRWSMEIANGMKYLAEKEVVHLDVATRNILLDAQKRAKIADFGLSRRLYGYSSYVKNGVEPLPWRWMSPESLQRSIFTEKTDVWAYGVTLWEIYTLGDVPYSEQQWDVDFPKLLNGGYRLKEPKYNEGTMYDLMTRCWEPSDKDRPSFSEIGTILLQNKTV